MVGQEYARRARALLLALDELDASVGPNGVAKAVTILADRAVIVHKLVPALTRVDAAARVGILRLLDRRESIVGGQFDIQVAETNVDRPDARVLFTTTMVLCAAPGYLRERPVGIAPRDLAGHSTIGLDGSSPSPTTVMPDVDAVAAAAVTGLGLARLPDYVIAPALADGRLVRVDEDRGGDPVKVFAWCSDEASSRARRLLDALLMAVD